LLIVGAGHVGQEVARLADTVDFDVWVVDDRAEYCSPERFPEARRLMVAPIDSALSGLDVDENTFCVIVTRGHNHDEEALYHLVETPAAYVGMIGSRRKIKLIFEDLLGEGISRDALQRVRAPLGFEIGSQSVPEIAVSIVAELVAVRNLEEVPEEYRRSSLVTELSPSSGSDHSNPSAAGPPTRRRSRRPSCSTVDSSPPPPPPPLCRA
jgi:xanthine dehydrogenase accessory factor